MNWQTTEDMSFEGDKGIEENNLKRPVLDAIDKGIISHGPSIEEEVLCN